MIAFQRNEQAPAHDPTRWRAALIVGRKDMSAEGLQRQQDALRQLGVDVAKVHHGWEHKATFPLGTDVVFAQVDYIGHSDSGAAKAAARMQGLPFVLISFKWARNMKALEAAGIVDRNGKPLPPRRGMPLGTTTVERMMELREPKHPRARRSLITPDERRIALEVPPGDLNVIEVLGHHGPLPITAPKSSAESEPATTPESSAEEAPSVSPINCPSPASDGAPTVKPAPETGAAEIAPKVPRRAPKSRPEDVLLARIDGETEELTAAIAALEAKMIAMAEERGVKSQRLAALTASRSALTSAFAMLEEAPAAVPVEPPPPVRRHAPEPSRPPRVAEVRDVGECQEGKDAIMVVLLDATAPMSTRGVLERLLVDGIRIDRNAVSRMIHRLGKQGLVRQVGKLPSDGTGGCKGYLFEAVR